MIATSLRLRHRSPGSIWRDRSGASVLEFALVAPVLIVMLLGIGDLAPTTMAKFKTGNATQSIADLAAQFSVAQTSDVAGLFASGADLLAPFSGATLVLRITNVASDGKGNAFVYWSCGQGALPPKKAKSKITDTPTGTSIDTLIWTGNDNVTGNGTNSSFVMVESQYTYTAPAQFIVTGPQLMSTTAYTLPRVSSSVGFPWDGNPDHVPTFPAAAKKTAAVAVGGGVTCNYAF